MLPTDHKEQRQEHVSKVREPHQHSPALQQSISAIAAATAATRQCADHKQVRVAISALFLQWLTSVAGRAIYWQNFDLALATHAEIARTSDARLSRLMTNLARSCQRGTIDFSSRAAALWHRSVASRSDLWFTAVTWRCVNTD